jgi:hypothetical protein
MDICLATGIILLLAVVCGMTIKSPSRLDVNDLQRVRRLSDKMRQEENLPLD